MFFCATGPALRTDRTLQAGQDRRFPCPGRNIPQTSNCQDCAASVNRGLILYLAPGQ